MEDLNRIRKFSLWVFVIPIVVINLCLFISVNFHLFQETILKVDPIGQSSFSIPYIDGGVSISRVSRTYPTYLFFKPGMILTSFFLIKYWIANNNLFKKLNNQNNKNNNFMYFGIGSAIFLTTHAIFLGINFDVDIYKFFRRFFLLGFIIFEVAAQALLVLNLYRVKEKISPFINKIILKLKIILVSVLIIVAILAAPILNSTEYSLFKHALEWNYFLGVIIFYLLTFLFWKKNKPSFHTPEGV